MRRALASTPPFCAPSLPPLFCAPSAAPSPCHPLAAIPLSHVQRQPLSYVQLHPLAVPLRPSQLATAESALLRPIRGPQRDRLEKEEGSMQGATEADPPWTGPSVGILPLRSRRAPRTRVTHRVQRATEADRPACIPPCCPFPRGDPAAPRKQIPRRGSPHGKGRQAAGQRDLDQRPSCCPPLPCGDPRWVIWTLGRRPGIDSDKRPHSSSFVRSRATGVLAAGMSVAAAASAAAGMAAAVATGRKEDLFNALDAQVLLTTACAAWVPAFAAQLLPVLPRCLPLLLSCCLCCLGACLCCSVAAFAA